MADIRIIGLDIAKSVFQLHGLDDAGATVLQKRLTRSRMLPFFEKLPPCLIGIEACDVALLGASPHELDEDPTARRGPVAWLQPLHPTV